MPARSGRGRQVSRRPHRRALGLAVIAIAMLDTAPRALQAPAAAPIRDRDVTIPMRDGVVLRADVLRPAEGRFPTLVYRTPYGKRPALDEYTTFARAVARG